MTLRLRPAAQPPSKQLSAELIEMVADDAAEPSSDVEDGEPDGTDATRRIVTAASASASSTVAPADCSPLPSQQIPVPRGAASLQLKWIFDFPTQRPSGTSDNGSLPAGQSHSHPVFAGKNPFEMFWSRSKGNLDKELHIYEPVSLPGSTTT
ncbi:hypothetical protein NUW54_g5762 [Trametes sanguinea]|uniref:Uncharacterized protein n=1 Tax=Trametes sanguinea TaxID=158606 RepID=A0ACC1PW98_9APHY|nr:hypothetical protein NUW54_g5762 [Trametes sanguinea]